MDVLVKYTVTGYDADSSKLFEEVFWSDSVDKEGIVINLKRNCPKVATMVGVSNGTSVNLSCIARVRTQT